MNNNKGILVGTFNEEDLKNGVDKIKVEQAKKLYNLKYTNSEMVYEGKKIVGIRMYVCDVDTFTL